MTSLSIRSSRAASPGLGVMSRALASFGIAMRSEGSTSARPSGRTGALKIYAVLFTIGLCSCADPAVSRESTAIVGIRSTVGPIDPAIAPSVEQTIILSPVYENLVRITADPETQADVFSPGVARSWEVSPDGLIWTFELAADHRFDDGASVNAEAVKFSIDRAIALGRGPSGQLSLLIDRVETDGAYRVSFILKRPVFSLLPFLSDRVGSIINPAVMAHERDGDFASGWLSTNTAGSGPYRLVRFAPRDAYVLSVNPYSRHEAGMIQQIIYREVNDPSIRALQLRRGDIDIAYFLPETTLQGFEESDRFEIHEVQTLAFNYLALNTQSGPFQNRSLRRAAAAAIDTNAIATELKQGRASPFRGPLPEGVDGADRIDATPSYDPELATQLVQDAKAAGADISINLIYPGVSPAADTMAVYMQASLDRVGFDVKLQRLTIPGLIERSQSGKYDAVFMGWVSPFADASNIMNIWFDNTKIGAAGNLARYSNAEVQVLLDRSMADVDLNRRTLSIVEAASLANQDIPYVYLVRNNMWVVSSSRLSGVQIDARDLFGVPFHKLNLAQNGGLQ